MAQVIDPVCDMTVDTETAEYKSEYAGATYYFCGAGCKRAFDKNPTEFIKQDQGEAGAAGGVSEIGGTGDTGHGTAQ